MPLRHDTPGGNTSPHARVTSAFLGRYRCDVDEAALIAAAQSDPDAFACLYDRTVASVYRFALSLVRNHADAEDLTAETYRRALARFPSYEDRGRPFVAWLITITRNLAADRARRNGREMPLLERDAAEDEWPGAGLVHEERAAAVHEALRVLTDEQRRAVILRYGQDLSHRQVAERMGKSEAAVKQLSYRASIVLRAHLEEAGFGRDD